MPSRRSFLGSVIGICAGVPFIAKMEEYEETPHYISMFETFIDCLKHPDKWANFKIFVVAEVDGQREEFLSPRPYKKVEPSNSFVRWICRDLHIQKAMTIIEHKILTPNNKLFGQMRFNQSFPVVNGDVFKLTYTFNFDNPWILNR